MKWLVGSFLAFLFFFSGFSALIYETLWIRDFAFLLGSTTYTLSVVLAAYMAGLAMGSLTASRLALGARRPILTYALLEIGVGLCGLGVRWVFQNVLKDLGPIGVLNNENLGPMLTRFLLSFAVLFPSTFLMGATLPFLTRFFPEADRKDGSFLGLLYGLNTLGAACGCFVTGFFLMRLDGMARSTYWAVGINLAVGLGALALGALAREYSRKEGDAPKRGPQKIDSAFSHPTTRFLLIAFCLSGFTSLSYEILYSRFLGYILGNRVYASSALITTFLLGIALGSLAVGWFIDRFGGELVLFSLFQVVVGLCGFLTLLYFPEILERIKLYEAAREFTDPWDYVRARFLEAFLLLVAPAFCFGAIFPSVIKYLHRGEGELPGVTGKAYSVNTLGCILGSLVTGFFVIPAFGTYYGMAVLASLSLLLGHRLLAPRWEAAPAWRKGVSVLVPLVLVLTGIGRAKASDRYPWPRKDMTRTFAYEDASTLVTAYDGPLGQYLYADDTMLSFPIGPRSRATLVQKLQGHLPMLLHPDPKRVLVVGLGFGVTPGSCAAYSCVDRVDCVEIFNGVVKAAPLFKGPNRDVVDQPKVHLVSGDGRYFLRHAPAPYDVIASNLTGSDLPGSATCYTKEFFELARAHLAPGGLFLVHAYGPDRYVIVKTLMSVFPHLMGFGAYHGTYYLVASMDLVRINDKRILKRLLSDPTAREDAHRAGIWGPADVHKDLLFDEKEAARRTAKLTDELNTDDLPILEYRFHGRDLNIFYGHL
ncbi:MAG TPA: fused MFS/spermidine synthase [bacterium]|nr:fused MFS/spermidine synthase [bacterium]